MKIIHRICELAEYADGKFLVEQEIHLMMEIAEAIAGGPLKDGDDLL